MAKPSSERIEQFKNGQLQLAQLFDVDAKQIAALLVLGHRLIQQGQLKKARNLFEGLAVLDAKNPYVHATLAAIYQKQENYPMAVARYSMALSIFPQDINSLTNRGEIYLKHGMFQQAAEDFQKAVNLDKNQKNAAANRARLLIATATQALKLAKEKGISAILDAKKQIDQQRSAQTRR